VSEVLAGSALSLVSALFLASLSSCMYIFTDRFYGFSMPFETMRVGDEPF
jgi:hypothetical protein